MSRCFMTRSFLCPLLCVMLLIGQLESLSAQSLPQRPGSKTAPVRVQDVRLGTDGVLYGSVVDSQGHAIAADTVTVRNGRRVLAQFTTDRKGRFAIRMNRGGVYELSSSNGRRIVRVWPAQTAPPKAVSKALIVDGGRVVRGQLPSGMSLQEIVVFGGLTFGGAWLIHRAVNRNNSPN